MTCYSYEKYLQAAIWVEHANEKVELNSQPLLLEVPGFPSGDLPLDEEARIVAQSLVAAGVDLDKMVIDDPLMIPEAPATAKAGWDIGVFTPNPWYCSMAINGEPKNRLAALDGILLEENGTVYFCDLYFNPDRPGDLSKECARREYEPGATLEENEERIRYGLARLVARHELELHG